MKILVLALTALSVSFVNAVQNRMGGTVREFLQDLREQKNISSTQYTKIESHLPDTEDIEMGKHDFDLRVFLNTKDGIKLKKYINQQLEKGKISEKTRTYLGSLLNLDTYTPSTTSSGTAHAGYTDNGIVLYHNKISPCTGSSCGDGEIYNGIWGFFRTSPDGKSSIFFLFFRRRSKPFEILNAAILNSVIVSLLILFQSLIEARPHTNNRTPASSLTAPNMILPRPLVALLAVGAALLPSVRTNKPTVPKDEMAVHQGYSAE